MMIEYRNYVMCNFIDKIVFYCLHFHSFSSKVKAKQETELEVKSFAPPYVCIEWLLRHHFQKLFTKNVLFTKCTFPLFSCLMYILHILGTLS